MDPVLTVPFITILARVLTPTTDKPPPILTSLLAVMIPIESTLVTSSYVNVPAIETLPLKVADVAFICPKVEIPGVTVRFKNVGVSETLTVAIPLG